MQDKDSAVELVAIEIPYDLANRIEENQRNSPYQYLTRDDYIGVILASQIPASTPVSNNSVQPEPPEPHIAGDSRTGSACYCPIGRDHE